MSVSSSGIETEVKIRVADADEARRLIIAAGFEEIRPRIFEANDVFDSPDGTLRSAGQLLRVRETGDRGHLTWKGPGVTGGPHKSRPELETAIGEPAAMRAILQALGYEPAFRYEKYRTEFASASTPGTITLDETPIGNFIEIEGEAGWIDRTASQLGFTQDQYLTSSYASLFFAEHSPGEHMVFSRTFPSQ